MIGLPAASEGFPQPLDVDDDDVAWALQTAAVEWKRSAYAEAIVWLRRAAEAAVQVDQYERAAQINQAANRLTEVASASRPAPWESSGERASAALGTGGLGAEGELGAQRSYQPSSPDGLLDAVDDDEEDDDDYPRVEIAAASLPGDEVVPEEVVDEEPEPASLPPAPAVRRPPSSAPPPRQVPGAGAARVPRNPPPPRDLMARLPGGHPGQELEEVAYSSGASGARGQSGASPKLSSPPRTPAPRGGAGQTSSGAAALRQSAKPRQGAGGSGASPSPLPDSGAPPLAARGSGSRRPPPPSRAPKAPPPPSKFRGANGASELPGDDVSPDADHPSPWAPARAAPQPRPQAASQRAGSYKFRAAEPSGRSRTQDSTAHQAEKARVPQDDARPPVFSIEEETAKREVRRPRPIRDQMASEDVVLEEGQSEPTHRRVIEKPIEMVGEADVLSSPGGDRISLTEEAELLESVPVDLPQGAFPDLSGAGQVGLLGVDLLDGKLDAPSSVESELPPPLLTEESDELPESTPASEAEQLARVAEAALAEAELQVEVAQASLANELAVASNLEEPASLALETQAVPEVPAVSPSGYPEGRREPVVLGISLGAVHGLEDLPEEAQLELVRKARLEALGPGEEVSFFAVALVVKGDVSIVPAIADTPCAHAQAGEVVFTAGTLENGVALSVVAGEQGAFVAVWDREALEQATLPCPWVADELRTVADRYQAMAGAAMGALGERLDDALRSSVFARCQVKLLLPGDTLFDAGQPVNGMHIVGAGRIEMVDGAGAVQSSLSPGDFILASTVFAGGAAPMAARAGAGGALVVHAGRRETHELIMMVPPLLEILSMA